MNKEEVKKAFAEKEEEMLDYLLYLYAHQNNVNVKYKLENSTKWRTPKKPK